MNVYFTSKDLAEFHEHATGTYSRRLPPDITRRFFALVGQIQAANDERQLRQLKSRRMEKVPSEGAGCYSMRVNDQWRLVFTLEVVEEVLSVVVKDLKDYH